MKYKFLTISVEKNQHNIFSRYDEKVHVFVLCYWLFMISWVLLPVSSIVLHVLTQLCNEDSRQKLSMIRHILYPFSPQLPRKVILHIIIIPVLFPKLLLSSFITQRLPVCSVCARVRVWETCERALIGIVNVGQFTFCGEFLEFVVFFEKTLLCFRRFRCALTTTHNWQKKTYNMDGNEL